MPVTIVKSAGTTVITVATDKKSLMPPVCQIMKTLCYSPVCCSVRKGMMQSSVTAALGTVQIMVGLFSIGLGPGRLRLTDKDFFEVGAAYWLGGVFLVSGLLTVLACRFSSFCLVGFTVLMNIAASIFSIVGIVLYSIDISNALYRFNCSLEKGSDRYFECENLKEYFQRLMVGMDITMIIMTVLQLCVSISLAVLVIKALCNRMKQQDFMDIEISEPELKEPLLSSPSY